jgi:hypothetical protein
MELDSFLQMSVTLLVSTQDKDERAEHNINSKQILKGSDNGA